MSVVPLYQYTCDRCGIETEEIEKFDAPKKNPCATEGCNGVQHRRLSAGSFHLKGGGWSDDGYSNGKPS